MISADKSASTPQNLTIFFECLDNAEHLLIDSWILLLRRSQFPGIESNHFAFLCNNSSKLFITYISIDVVDFIRIIKSQKHLLRHFIIDSIKNQFKLRSTFILATGRVVLSSKRSQRRHQM